MEKQNRAPHDAASAQIERFGGLITLKEGVPTKDRLISCNAYTGAVVDRYDYWTGERYRLQLALDGVDLSRVEAKSVPVYDNHMSYGGAESVLGIVENAYVDGGTLKADLRFSMSSDVDGVWSKIQEGVIASVSVGAAIKKLQDISGENDKIKTYLAVNWTLMEISPTGMPADASAGFLSAQLGRDTINLSKLVASPQAELSTDRGEEAQKEETMAEPAITPQPAVTSPPPAQLQVTQIDQAHVQREAKEAATLAVQAERQRANDIRTIVKTHRLSEEFATNAINGGWDMVKVREEALNARATAEEAMGTQQVHHSARVTNDDTQKFRGNVENFLMHTDRPDKVVLEGGRQYMGMSMLEVAKECLTRKGVDVRGKGKDEIAKLALQGTSDFPFITENVANKSLRAGYDAFPQTFRPIARQVTVADFKPLSMPLLGGQTALPLVNESGEVKYGRLYESKNTVAVKTYAEIIPMTRQLIINDDKGAFTRVPFLMGSKAATTESNLVWGIITANAAMFDNVAIFHATHANLVGTGTAISVASLGVMRALIRKQKDLDNSTVINFTPRYIIAGTDLETDMAQILTAITPALVASAVPEFIRSMVPVIEPRLDVASGAKPWYVAADPAQGDGLVYAYLEGQQGVYTETKMGFDVEGIEIKARLDIGAAMIDHRTWAKNNGV